MTELLQAITAALSSTGTASAPNTGNSGVANGNPSRSAFSSVVGSASNGTSSGENVTHGQGRDYQGRSSGLSVMDNSTRQYHAMRNILLDSVDQSGHEAQPASNREHNGSGRGSASPDQ
jgi:hypothetical protein